MAPRSPKTLVFVFCAGLAEALLPVLKRFEQEKAPFWVVANETAHAILKPHFESTPERLTLFDNELQDGVDLYSLYRPDQVLTGYCHADQRKLLHDFVELGVRVIAYQESLILSDINPAQQKALSLVDAVMVSLPEHQKQIQEIYPQLDVQVVGETQLQNTEALDSVDVIPFFESWGWDLEKPRLLYAGSYAVNDADYQNEYYRSFDSFCDVIETLQETHNIMLALHPRIKREDSYEVLELARRGLSSVRVVSFHETQVSSLTWALACHKVVSQISTLCLKANQQGVSSCYFDCDDLISRHGTVAIKEGQVPRFTDHKSLVEFVSDRSSLSNELVEAGTAAPVDQIFKTVFTKMSQESHTQTRFKEIH